MFPLLFRDVDKYQTLIGVTIGFTFGLIFIFGIESLITSLTNWLTSQSQRGDYIEIVSNDLLDRSTTDLHHEIVLNLSKPNEESKEIEGYQFYGVTSEPLLELSSHLDQILKTELKFEDEDWEEDDIQRSLEAISTTPRHKEHIISHLNEIVRETEQIEFKCLALLQTELSKNQVEAISEEIDEASHKLQYKADHCRRFDFISIPKLLLIGKFPQIVARFRN